MTELLLLILSFMSVNSDSQVSLNRIITKPEDLNIISLDGFDKGGYLNIFYVRDGSRKAEVMFSIDEESNYDEMILSVSPRMSSVDILSVFSEVDDRRYYLGIFSPERSFSFSRKSKDVIVDVDVLKFENKPSRLTGGIVFFNNSNLKPSINLINIILTDTKKKNPYRRFVPQRMINLNVPKISQMSQQVEYNQDICSPTSLSMVFGYYGVNVDTLSVALGVYDETESIYGNWFFNTAYASYLGFYAFIARINSLEMLYKILDSEVPVVASISFGPGELKNAPIKKTKGHLVVIKGMGEKGEIIVNDPASVEGEKVEIRYDQEEFFNAWIRNKYGTSYIIADRKRIEKILEVFKGDVR